VRTRSRLRIERARGFTLLEVLVAVLVFSIGLLGIASLQLAGLRHTHDSHLRAVATMKAAELVDRMRANHAGYQDGQYDVTAVPQMGTDCATGPCDPVSLAFYDLAKWQDGVAQVLPCPTANGTLACGLVCRDSTPDDWNDGDGGCDLDPTAVYAIKVRWRERPAGQADVQEDIKMLVMRVLPW
jgi:type IV pilus assembly protein PilV